MHPSTKLDTASVSKRHTLCYNLSMKYYSWSAEKNDQLKRDRNISFGTVVFHIDRADVLDILEHSNPSRYPGQRIFVVNIDNYAYLVPFVETEHEVFLKTIIPKP